MQWSHIAYFGQIVATAAAALLIIWTTRSGSTTKWMSGLLAAICTVLGIACFLLSDPPAYFADFRSGYYPAGQAVLSGPSMLRPLTMLGVSGFASMPIVAYVFAPLSLLRERYAIGLFSVAGLVAITASWFLLVRLTKLELTERWLLALFFVASGPLQYSFKEGNLSHFILFVLVAGLALLRSSRSIPAGVALGAAAVFKPPLLLFVAFFLLWRNIRAGISFLGVFVVAAGLSIILFGWRDNVNWLHVCIVQYSHRWLGAFNDQSVASFLMRLRTMPSLLLDWKAYPPPSGMKLVEQVVVGLLYVAAFIFCIRWEMKGRQNAAPGLQVRRDVQYILVPALVIVASPLVWSHYYCWLLIPTAFFLSGHSVLAQSRGARMLGWLAILLCTPLVRPLVFHDHGTMMTYWRYGVSHFLLGGLIWFGLLTWSIGRGASRPAASQSRCADVAIVGSTGV